VEVTPELSFDLATFYNKYDNILGVTPGSPVFVTDPQPHLQVPLAFANGTNGETYGAELSAQWRPRDYWLLGANYTFLNMRIDPDGGSAVSTGCPQQQVGMRSYLTLPWNLELNCAAYFVDQIAPFQ